MSNKHHQIQCYQIRLTLNKYNHTLTRANVCVHLLWNHILPQMSIYMRNILWWRTILFTSSVDAELLCFHSKVRFWNSLFEICVLKQFTFSISKSSRPLTKDVLNTACRCIELTDYSSFRVYSFNFHNDFTRYTTNHIL